MWRVSGNPRTRPKAGAGAPVVARTFTLASYWHGRFGGHRIAVQPCVPEGVDHWTRWFDTAMLAYPTMHRPVGVAKTAGRGL